MAQSLNSGRPPIFRQSIVECQFPEDPWATKRDDGSILPSGMFAYYPFMALEVFSRLIYILQSGFGEHAS